MGVSVHFVKSANLPFRKFNNLLHLLKVWEKQCPHTHLHHRYYRRIGFGCHPVGGQSPFATPSIRNSELHQPSKTLQQKGKWLLTTPTGIDFRMGNIGRLKLHDAVSEHSRDRAVAVSEHFWAGIGRPQIKVSFLSQIETTKERITATEHPEMRTQLQTRQVRGDSHRPLRHHQTGNRTRPKNAPNPLSSKRDHCLQSFSKAAEAAAASAPPSSLYAAGL
jgi:hypothetical protein